MKKLTFTVAMVILAMLSFTSCEDSIVSSDETIDLLPKATISGTVLAELNLQSDGLETVPEGTQLLVEVNYSDINPAASAGKWMDTIQVSADGKYSVQVPTDANGVSVSISPFTFEAEQTQKYTEVNYTTIKKVYSASLYSLTISAGNDTIQNISYTAANEPTFAYKVTLTGKCQANLSAETPGLENAPNGTVLNFYNNEWKDSVTVNNGTYTIMVPNTTIYCNAKFTQLKSVWNTNLISYQNISYKYTINSLSITPSSSVNTLALSFGEGEDQTVDSSPNTTTLSGTATAESDATLSGTENMPDGTKIYFEDDSKTWGATATVSSGKYSVSIPRSTTGIYTINYSINYNANKRTSSTSVSVYNFTGSGSLSTTSISTKTLNIIAN
ncbi:MAG: hypothetical protein PHS59_06065 [Paludibacter sp.]|nr:hypothetical protein [Paludibacter sp.]